MSDDPDLNELPTDVDLPSSLNAGEGLTLDAETLVRFDFCVLFNGRAWFTLPVAAPSPELAATTVDQYVRQVLNPSLQALKYPPNICSWRAGACG